MSILQGRGERFLDFSHFDSMPALFENGSSLSGSELRWLKIDSVGCSGGRRSDDGDLEFRNKKKRCNAGKTNPRPRREQ